MINTPEEIRTGGEALNASEYIFSLNRSTSNFSLPMESLFAGKGSPGVVSTQETFKLTREHRSPIGPNKLTSQPTTEGDGKEVISQDEAAVPQLHDRKLPTQM